MYYIRHRVTKSVWQTSIGWVEKEPSFFPEHMTEKLPLPPGGEWVELPKHLVSLPPVGEPA